MSFKFGPGLPNKGKLLKMPRRTKMSVWKDKELTSVGPGTVFHKAFDISATTRERALLLNKTEDHRLERIMRRIGKEQRFTSNLHNKVIQRMSNTLQERQVMSHLLEEDYKVKNFITLRQGFDSNKINSKENARRYVIESRVLNSGFNIKAMRPEIHRKIRKMDSNHDYSVAKKRLHADIKDQNAKIIRSVSNKTSGQMLNDRKQMQNYNYPQKQDVSSIETLTRTPLHENEAETVHDRNETEHVQDFVENTTFKDSEIDNYSKRKSIVLERRLPLREPNTFSMARSKPTLGPVYFQASVSTEQVV